MEVGNSSNALQRNALIFPADGTTARLVSYSIKQRLEGDGSVDFYDYLPDLRPWLERAFPQRDFADFYGNSRVIERIQDCHKRFVKLELLVAICTYLRGSTAKSYSFT